MDEPPLPPAEVLAVFLEIKRYVDSTVSALQAAAAPTVNTASISATLPALQANFTVATSEPAPLAVSRDEVRMARAWIEGAKAAGAAAVAVSTFEGLLQFVERLLDLAK
ncbi:hypothetical protein ABZ914_05625 [Spirillospora sp. NPDC046719]